MRIASVTSGSTLLALAFGTGACAPHAAPGAPLPARTFATVAEAKACALDALASAGFLPVTRVSPGPNGGTIPGETPTGVNSRVVTQLGDREQIDYASAGAQVRVGPGGDTTVTVGVSVQTLLSDGPHSATVQPLSSNAVRARDAVMTQCQGSEEPGAYPRST
jgi:hypothetical protein